MSIMFSDLSDILTRQKTQVNKFYFFCSVSAFLSSSHKIEAKYDFYLFFVKSLLHVFVVDFA
jgi:hypothetical protein